MSDTHSETVAYVHETMLPPEPPPLAESGAIKWLRENLFSGPLNIALTFVGLGIVWLVVSTVGPWLSHSVWNAGSMAECRQVIAETWGQGASVKTINQLLCGVHIAAAAEALTLGEKAGLDGKLLLQILGNSAAASWMLNNRGQRMLESDPQSSSAVDIFVKDLGIVADAGRASRVALPLAAAALQMYLAASGAGHGKADDSQVIRAYRALNGLS